MSYPCSIQKGHPPTVVSLEDAKYLLSLGMSKTKVAKILGISRQTLYTKFKASGNADFEKYSHISDQSLDSTLEQFTWPHANLIVLAAYTICGNSYIITCMCIYMHAHKYGPASPELLLIFLIFLL